MKTQFIVEVDHEQEADPKELLVGLRRGLGERAGMSDGGIFCDPDIEVHINRVTVLDPNVHAVNLGNGKTVKVTIPKNEDRG